MARGLQTAALVLLALLLACAPQLGRAQLAFNFYNGKCGTQNVEKIIFTSIAASLKSNPGFAPGIVRLHFHDAFVRGADGSVLPVSPAERDAPPNAGTLRGFEAIYAAKAAVEAVCPGVVSCADVLAYANRDAIKLAGGPAFTIRGGRRDAFGSLASDVGSNLPSPASNVDQLVAAFVAKGLTQDDVVVLSGAHTIGQAHCRAFGGRLYPTVDPTLNATRAAALKGVCPTATTDATTGMDVFTPAKWDTGYYRGLPTGNGLFTSDQVLWSDTRTQPLASSLANQAVFNSRFVASIRKMGEIGVLTGTQGQIKTDCSVA